MVQQCTKFEDKQTPIKIPILEFGLYYSWDKGAQVKTPPPQAKTPLSIAACGLLK